jgi:predicted DNA-binding ribbon-helix-helix protein
MKTKVTSIRLEEELHKEYLKNAEKENRTLSNYIINCVEEHEDRKKENLIKRVEETKENYKRTKNIFYKSKLMVLEQQLEECLGKRGDKK